MDQLAGLLEASPTPIVVADEDGRIAAANGHAEALLRREDGGLVGAHLGDVFRCPDSAAGLQAACDLPPADGPEHLGRDVALVADAADGSRVPVEVAVDSAVVDDETLTVASVTETADRAAAPPERAPSEAELRRVVETSPAPIVIYDSDGVVRYANDAVASLVGLDDPADVVGTPAIEYVHLEEREEARAAIRHVLEAREAVRGVDRRLQTVDGETRHTILSSAPVRFGGEPAAEVVLNDVTELKERERELERRNERLDEFASIVSHDLRNPLAILRSSLELAAEGDEDGEHLARCQRAVDRMERLVDDLLTIARHGDAPVETEPVALAAVATDAWEAVASPGATLSVEGSRQVDADRERLQVLLENLLRNAVEHGSTSPPSRAREDAAEGAGPEVSVTVGATDEGFFVADDGPGVPPAERGDVFESGYSTADEGTGFGLSIVREIAEAHGWTVSLTESEAGGARFEITGA